MKIAEIDILIVPGLDNSGPGHWQSRWVDKMPTARRVEQDDWSSPEATAWTDRLHEAILYATRPVVLVGHSLGVHAIVRVAERLVDTKVKGAFLVTAPDLDAIVADYPQVGSFRPVPTNPLPFPSFLVASQSDPLCTAERAQHFALDWGSELHLAGDAGHINAESGHGPWPEGMMMFARFLKRLGPAH